MSKVYHDNRFPIILEEDSSFPSDFNFVAECDSENLDKIFRLTNHIDQFWWLNEGVIKIATEGSRSGQLRSTSVGDVVVLSNGDAYVCRTLGWSLIGSVGNEPLEFKSGILTK